MKGRPAALVLVKRILVAVGPVTEVGYNALHDRLGVVMSNTERLTPQQRPAGNNNLMSAWETLTHADNPA
jgi:hypothetical protein